MADVIFEPLKFKNLTVKNRIFRSNVSGRFDNYDGSGNQPRINWEEKFARGGVGAIMSSYVPVQLHGRIMPGYATIHRDDGIPFWRAVGNAVHKWDCKYILQLSHGGRQRDIPGIEFPVAQSSTSRPDPLHGFECAAMTKAEIDEMVAAFGEAPAGRGRRARRRRTARRQRLSDHAVPELGDQRSEGRVRRSARKPGALRDRDRQVHPQARRRRLPSADEDQRDRVQQRAPRPQAREAGQRRRRFRPGLQVADRRRCGQHSRLDRQLVPTPA